MEDIFKIVDNITLLKDVKSIKIFGQELTHMPFFTIAIPTYKRPSLLKEALDSALNQDGFDDFNVMVCDNNPERNDDTEELMQSYKGNPKVTYYKHTQNVGMAGNWNKCAMLSDSERFVLLHDDDIIYPNALRVFSSCLSNISSEWSLIKPELDKFVTIDNISKKIGSYIFLHRLNYINFFESCPVGAPTVILLNKQKFLSIGGVDNNRYPCIDYEMSLKLSKIGISYLLEGNLSLGGYRVGNNESLSEKTMDGYFIQRSLLSTQLMKFCGLPTFAIKVLDLYFENICYKTATKYYNMPEYHMKIRNKNNKNNVLSKTVIFLYRAFSRLYIFFNLKAINI